MKRSSEYVEISYISDYTDHSQKYSTIDYRELPEEILVSDPIELHEVSVTSQVEGIRTVYHSRANTKLKYTLHNLPAVNLRRQNRFTIIINDAPSFSIQIESRILTLKQWDIILLNPSTRCVEFCKGGEHLYYLSFSEEYISSCLAANDISIHEISIIGHYLQSMIQNKNFQNKDFLWMHYKQIPDSSPIELLIQNIITEFLEKQPGYNFFIRGYLYRLLHAMTQSSIYSYENICIDDESKFTAAHAVKEYLDRIDSAVSKVQLGLKFGYDGEYLNRIFRHYYHCSISEYQRKQRLYQAAALLKTTNYSIQSICNQIGFHNRTYFYQIFKKEFSCSPMEYRRQCIKKQDAP